MRYKHNDKLNTNPNEHIARKDINSSKNAPVDKQVDNCREMDFKKKKTVFYTITIILCSQDNNLR